MSALFPGSSDPTHRSTPWARAGLIVYLARYWRIRGLSCSGRSARIRFIWCASCQVRRITSPIRPIPWESELMMLIAPRSCSTLSARIVESRTRSAIIARSLGTRGFMPWTDHIMAWCSATTFRP